MAKIITATINPETGEVEVDLSGFKGKGCHAIQDVISKALGGETVEEKRKSEYNAPVSQTNCITR